MRNLCYRFVMVILLLISGPIAKAQSDEVQQLLLNVEKLNQLKHMLENMKDKYLIIRQGYNQVKGIAEGNFNLHQAFLNRLLKVNPNVRAYYKVGEIVELQISLIRGMAKVKQEFRWSDFLEEQEFAQVDRLFSVWSRSSLNLLEELLLILSDNQLEMGDWERIEAIDRLHASVLNLSKGVAMFANSISELGDLRNMKSRELTTLQTLFGDESN